MKKHIIVVESDAVLRERWTWNLDKLRTAGYEGEYLEAMPEVPGKLFQRLVEDKDCYLVLGSTGRPKVEGSRIYDAACALGYDRFVCLSAGQTSTRYDVGFPLTPPMTEFERHGLMLAAFLAGSKYVQGIPGAPGAVRFDCLPATMRKPSFSSDVAAIYGRLSR